MKRSFKECFYDENGKQQRTRSRISKTWVRRVLHLTPDVSSVGTEAEASLLLRSEPAGTLYATTVLRLRTTLRCGKSHTRVRTPPLPHSPVRTPLLPRASVSCAIAAVIVAVVVGVPRCRRPEKGNFCPLSQWRRCDKWLAALMWRFHIVVTLTLMRIVCIVPITHVCLVSVRNNYLKLTEWLR